MSETDIPATLEGRSGHGVERRRGRSYLGGNPRAALERAQARLLALSGAEVTRVRTNLGDGAIHHLEVGRGRPLVLLHGAGGGGANWYRLLKALGEERRVLAPDLPGFGFSDPMPVHAPLGEHAARRVEAWLNANGLAACDAAGTSFGGLIAIRLAQRGCVERLVLLDAAGLG
ncbi:MAG: alpha/beta fold hydrolase, partial [Longimicrobiales bacterium]